MSVKVTAARATLSRATRESTTRENIYSVHPILREAEFLRDLDSTERCADVVVNRLTFIVVFRAEHAPPCRDALRSLVGFKAHKQLLLAVSLLLVAQTAIGKHQRV